MKINLYIVSSVTYKHVKIPTAAHLATDIFHSRAN
jgi:hypothetical protein